MLGGFWDEVERMHDEMESLFNSLYRNPVKRLAGPEMAIENRNFRKPLCDMQWKDNKLVTTFELPGVDKKDIDLNIGDGFMEVKVDKEDKSEKKENGAESYFYSRNQFYRRVPLPENVDLANAQAELKNGVLEVGFPKLELEDKKTKKLEIK